MDNNLHKTYTTEQPFSKSCGCNMNYHGNANPMPHITGSQINLYPKYQFGSISKKKSHAGNDQNHTGRKPLDLISQKYEYDPRPLCIFCEDSCGPINCVDLVCDKFVTGVF